MAISVITLVRDRVRELGHLLGGLERSPTPPAELIVAWMGGEDPTRALARSRIPSSVVSLDEPELPLARARNLAARRARSEALVFLDVDCIPAAALLSAYARALGAQDALVAGRTLYLPPGPVPETEQRLAEVAREHPARAGLFTADVRTDDRHDLFWSLSFAIRQPTFTALGGFDEEYAGYGIEDTDFALRARKGGVRLAWAREALAFHQHHPPASADSRNVPALVRNARRFQRTWGTWPAAGWFDELASRGLVEWDPERDLLEVTTPAP